MRSVKVMKIIKNKEIINSTNGQVAYAY